MKRNSIIIIISFILLSILGFLQILVSIDCIVDQAEIGFGFCYSIEYQDPYLRPILYYDVGLLQFVYYSIYLTVISVIGLIIYFWRKRK